MRLLIVGAGGFIGEHLTRFLAARGHRVGAVDSEARLPILDSVVAGQGAIELLARDVPRLEAADPIFRGRDALLHLYSTSSPASSMADIEKDARGNILVALRLLEACRENGIGVFVFASSGGAVYGETQSALVDEDHATNPKSAYGIVKLSVEKYMRLFSQRFGIRTVALRIGNAYGPGQLRGARVGAIANFVRRVYRNEPIDIWGDGSIVRDYIYIDDVVSAFEAAVVHNGLRAFEYNVGTGTGYSLSEIIGHIETASARRAIVRYNPARAVDVSRLVLDSSRFRAASGWEPRLSLSQGIEALCQRASRADPLLWPDR
jgi:UDP-glucose 4-epimerase